MPEQGEVPISEVLANSKGVEESWNKFVPISGGAEGNGVPEFDRGAAIEAAVQMKRDIRSGKIPDPRFEMGVSVPPIPNVVSNIQHFFVCKDRGMKFIGTKEVDVSKFQKDISGHFFREWVKSVFPDRRDYDDIVSFGDETPLGDIVDLFQ